MRRREDLATPRRGGGRGFGIFYDPEAFGKFSESIARFLGTARFLVFQTTVVIIWIALNLAATAWRWDPYPFILLNLAFSTQAAYAAPLILLAQNRQAERDRDVAQRDRDEFARTQADTEFLAREVASIRLGLADVVTNADLEDHVDRVTKALERLTERIDRLTAPVPPG